MTQHTAGPWTIEHTPDGVPMIVAREAPGESYVAMFADRVIKFANSEANARLMVQAKVMLEELRLIAEGWRKIDQLRPLTPWEAERLSFVEDLVAAATDPEELR